MRFRLVTLLWATAVLATGMALSPGVGLIASFAVIGFWLAVIQLITRTQRWVGTAILLAFCTLILPAMQHSVSMAGRSECMNNLKYIMLGLLNYESARSSFPLAATRDPNGKLLHSWRYAILPNVDQLGLGHPYIEIQANRPWDSPVNARLFARPEFDLDVFCCPNDRTANVANTSYFAVVDSRTVWPPDRGVTLREVADGTSQTVALVEVPHRRVPWYKPEDLSFDEAVRTLTTRPKPEDAAHSVSEGFYYKPTPATHVAFLDGHVELLRLPLTRETAEALLTRAGGEAIDFARLDDQTPPELDYGKIATAAVFAVLAMLPAFRRG
jgi:prepilin-type processing-associated H-X9-DG protein